MNPTESNNCKIIENLGYEQGCISEEGRALTMHDKKRHQESSWKISLTNVFESVPAFYIFTFFLNLI